MDFTHRFRRFRIFIESPFFRENLRNLPPKTNQKLCILFSENISKEGEDVVSPAEMKKILYVKELEDLLDGKLGTYNHASFVSCVWCDAKQLEGTELPFESKVRLRTKGDGCYLGKVS